MEHKNFEGKEQTHPGWLFEIADTSIMLTFRKCDAYCVHRLEGGRIPEGSVKGFALS